MTRSRILAAHLATVLIFAGPSRVHGQPEGRRPLFQPVSIDWLESRGLERSAATAQLSTLSRQGRAVRVDTQVLEEGSSIELNLSPEFTIGAERLHFQRNGSGGYTWTGTPIGAPGSVVLAVQDGRVLGTAQIGSQSFLILPAVLGLHVITSDDPDAYPPDHPSEVEPEEASGEPDSPSADEADAPATVSARPVIRVLVAYTPAAMRRNPDLESVIWLSLAGTNLAFQQSGIDASLELAGVHPVDYVESSSFMLDLERFRKNGDGEMDEIHSLRQTTAADVCVLLLANEDSCGLSAAIGANEDNAFAVVSQKCAAGKYSLAHELGHLLGSRHNLEKDSKTRPFPEGHGHLEASEGWRTIMAYDSDSCRRPCVRVLRWSNPRQQLNGRPLGRSGSSDNAALLSRRAIRVAAYFP